MLPSNLSTLIKYLVLLFNLSNSLFITSSIGERVVNMSKTSASQKTVIKNLIQSTKREFHKAANPETAMGMQNYMKTTMPCYGIKAPQRRAIQTIVSGDLVMDSPIAYETCLRALWALPHREEKYFAIDTAIHYKNFIELENLGLYEEMIRAEYAWWDLVDPIAIHLVGDVAYLHPETLEPILRQWINDDNIWIRRTAILCQLKHKKRTNQDMLFEFCRERMHEKEFFIQKAIGWALRSFGKSAPEAVISFLRKEKPYLSKLSYREGSRILIKEGKMKA